eukprot:jgi/Tetstr1/453100/TSEL_003940.t1
MGQPHAECSGREGRPQAVTADSVPAEAELYTAMLEAEDFELHLGISTVGGTAQDGNFNMGDAGSFNKADPAGTLEEQPVQRVLARGRSAALRNGRRQAAAQRATSGAALLALLASWTGLVDAVDAGEVVEELSVAASSNAQPPYFILQSLDPNPQVEAPWLVDEPLTQPYVGSSNGGLPNELPANGGGLATDKFGQVLDAVGVGVEDAHRNDGGPPIDQNWDVCNGISRAPATAAWLTFASSDSYLPGVYALYGSLLRQRPGFAASGEDFAVLVTCGVSKSAVAALCNAGMRVLRVCDNAAESDAVAAAYGKGGAGAVALRLPKLNVFRVACLWRKIVYVDADMVFLQDPGHLLSRPAGALLAAEGQIAGRFNSGLFVHHCDGGATWAAMREEIATLDSCVDSRCKYWDRMAKRVADQGFLNGFYKRTSGPHHWRPVSMPSYMHNAKVLFYVMGKWWRPGGSSFPLNHSKVVVLHWIGDYKPWQPPTNFPCGNTKKYCFCVPAQRRRYEGLLAAWWQNYSTGKRAHTTTAVSSEKSATATAAQQLWGGLPGSVCAKRGPAGEQEHAIAACTLSLCFCGARSVCAKRAPAGEQEHAIAACTLNLRFCGAGSICAKRGPAGEQEHDIAVCTLNLCLGGLVGASGPLLDHVPGFSAARARIRSAQSRRHCTICPGRFRGPSTLLVGANGSSLHPMPRSPRRLGHATGRRHRPATTVSYAPVISAARARSRSAPTGRHCTMCPVRFRGPGTHMVGAISPPSHHVPRPLTHPGHADGRRHQAAAAPTQMIGANGTQLHHCPGRLAA